MVHNLPVCASSSPDELLSLESVPGLGVLGVALSCDRFGTLTLMQLDETNGALKSSIWDGGLKSYDYGSNNPDHAITFVDAVVQTGGVVSVVRYAPNDGGAATFSFSRFPLDGGSFDVFDGNVWSVEDRDTTPTSLALDPSNRVLVTGIARTEDGGRGGFVWRFTSLGGPDNTWAFGGAARSSDEYITTVPHQGGYVTVGIKEPMTDGRGVVSRRTASGDLDTAFAANGTLVTNATGSDLIYSAVVQSDGKIVLVGANFANNITDGDSKGLLGRLNANGSWDTSFGTGGRALFDLTPDRDQFYRAHVGANGAITVSGTTSGNNTNAVLLRTQANGALDSSFGTMAGSTRVFSINPQGPSFAISGRPFVKVPGGYLQGGSLNDDVVLLRYFE